MVTKDEYLEWLRNPVTRELKTYLRNEIEQARDVLSTEAGNVPLQDRYLVGGITVCTDLLDWQPDFMEINES